MSIRGINTSVREMRKKIYAEVARLSYNYQEGDLKQIDMIPFKLVPGEVSEQRDNVFLERAIVGDLVRLALGLNIRSATEPTPVSFGAEECLDPEKYYDLPLINVVSFACHGCPDNKVRVSDQCQGCLAHPCSEVCPKGAIKMVNGRSVIDEDLCVKCGKCVSTCPYGAIIHLKRPCVSACGVNAIGSDEYGRATIDQDKCVKCGQCFANCPYGAISDKAQIFQTIRAIQSDVPVYAAVAPAFVGQFGPDMTMKGIRAAIRALGFEDAIEVAIGADLCTIQEAEDFVKEVPSKIPFMGTSCCPAWSSMAKSLLPGQEDCISMALTPMVLTARLIKEQHPGCKVAFIGPCSAKKREARRKNVRSEVDFVLTFEEVQGMFEAKEIDFKNLELDKAMHGASGDARGFAISGGVSDAVSNIIGERYPELEVKVERAEGLEACKKMLLRAKNGKYDGYLLEGMACPHGCVGGAGTVQPIEASKRAVEKNKAGSTHAHASESSYQNLLDILKKE